MVNNQCDLVKSVSQDQREILSNIIRLYCPDGFDLDPTYSAGVFYKDGVVPEPKMRFDLAPQREDVQQSDCRSLPLPDGSVVSIVFDPPFVGGSRKDGKPGIIKTRFSYFSSIPVLREFYREALLEFYRVLRLDGILVFKCQDSVESAKQYMSHVAVMNMAYEVGYYPLDLFILTATTRIISPNQWNQSHARKYHSYFWVFQKKGRTVVQYPVPAAPLTAPERSQRRDTPQTGGILQPSPNDGLPEGFQAWLSRIKQEAATELVTETATETATQPETHSKP
jgi:hypothetical protein